MTTRLTDLLRCDLPIQLAPMGACPRRPPFRSPWQRRAATACTPVSRSRRPRSHRCSTPSAEQTAAFGVNFIVPLMDRESLELAVERAPYVDFFLADADPELVALVHDGGAVCGWQVESADEARAAEAAGCDLVIAKAWESGGRKRIEGPTLLPLLDGVLDAVSIPVIAAGGIATPRGVAAALAAGADGVRVGTRFIATAESDADPAWIDALIGAGAADAVVSTAFNVGLPVPGRSGPALVDRGGGGARRRLRWAWCGSRERRSRYRGSRHSRPRESRPARSKRCPSTPASRRAP